MASRTARGFCVDAVESKYTSLTPGWTSRFKIGKSFFNTKKSTLILE
jgi:hypothetical protein